MRVSGRDALAAVVLAAALGAAAAAASTGATAFHGSVTPIGSALAKRMTGVSWHRGCPVGLGDLRAVHATYLGFDGKPHAGTVIVHRRAAGTLLGVLRRLYAERFAIRRMEPVDAYGGSDFRSIEADNTSAFNCRYVDGTTHWSNHAFGLAIDVNPIENPYVGSDGSTAHAASGGYLRRSPARTGMAVEGGALVRAFDAAGWGWGGRWSGAKDYQHFSADGR